MKAHTDAAEAELTRLRDENERLAKELARANQLHDATCFTRPRIEAAEAKLACVAQVEQEIRAEAAEQRTPLARAAGCQSEPAWHADKYDKWADTLASLRNDQQAGGREKGQ